MKQIKAADDKLFKLAIQLRNAKKYNESIEKLQEFIATYPHHKKLHGAYLVMAGIYLDNLKDPKKALLYGKKTKKLKPGYELASLLIYLAFVKMEAYEKAINEMYNFLKKHKADLYKDTIKELLGDLKNGYALTYKDKIFKMAIKNDIRIPKVLR